MDDHYRQADADVLITAVSGLGPEREPDEQAEAEAARIDTERGEQPDLRGKRDRERHAEHPWREDV